MNRKDMIARTYRLALIFFRKASASLCLEHRGRDL
jgi:hypothetical protein